MIITRWIFRQVYMYIAKPLFFRMQPDDAHNFLVKFARRVQGVPGFVWFGRMMFSRRNYNRLHQNIAGIDMASPVGLSAGFDKNIELQPTMRMVGFGFMTGGSITLRPRTGNARPWFYRLIKTKSIVVNAGLANHGLEKTTDNITTHKKYQQSMPLFVSVAVVACEQGNDNSAITDACQVIDQISRQKICQAIEINISCPNVNDDQPFTYPDKLEELLAEVDKINVTMPIFVKMPNLDDFGRFEALLDCVARHDIAGVTIANLVKERSRVELSDELSDSIRGGLSGTPCRDSSTELIKLAYKKYGGRLVIIGVGGVFSADDAYQKIRAGASLVGLITGLMFEGPQLVGDINHQLNKRLKRDGFESITDVVGIDVVKSKK